MVERMIEKYVNTMTYDDVNRFANQNGVFLTNEELQIVFREIKQNWRTIIYGNPEMIFQNLKNSIAPTTYQKIEGLFFEFKNKYRAYL